jgi:hypothetical protein
MRQALFLFLGLLLALPGPRLNWAGDKPPTNPKQPKNDPKSADGDGLTIVRSEPTQVGDVEPAYWGALTEDQQNEAVAQLKAFAKRAADQVKRPLRLQERKYFLFYSDLPEMEAARCVALLERMYAKLVELFPVEKGRNIWRGKALVFVFLRIEDYHLYERLAESNDPAGSFGMTHCFGDGMVHMAFYRYPDEMQFSHLLVHESVHGFLHRYRSPIRIPSWINEGLADDLAARLVANPRRPQFIGPLVRIGLAQHNNNLGDFFTARHIDGWQYPIAETLTTWLIHKDSRGYLDFINGIKDGKSWEESLKVNMKLSKDRMMSEYAKAMELKPIRS